MTSERWESLREDIAWDELNYPEDVDQEDQEPTAEQESAWDVREDDVRGHALDEHLDDL